MFFFLLPKVLYILLDEAEVNLKLDRLIKSNCKFDACPLHFLDSHYEKVSQTVGQVIKLLDQNLAIGKKAVVTSEEKHNLKNME